MKVVIVDLGSKLNRFGGQARIASILYYDLKKFFDMYYIGYETEFLKADKNTIMLKRGKAINLAARKSRLSEVGFVRFVYNLIIVRSMYGIDKKAILSKMLKIRPDVIIANSIQDITLLMYLKRNGVSFKSIYIDHGSLSTSIRGYFSKEGVPLTVGSGLLVYSVNHAIKKYLNFFDVNVALNGFQLTSMRKFTDRVKCIANGIDIKIKFDEKVEGKLRKNYGLNNNDFVVLYLGRMFERQKNVSTLIKAFLQTSEKNLKLLLVGEGPSLDDYKKLVDGDRRVVFTGSIKDEFISYIYNIANLFVLPSRWEGLSLTTIEAASHSLPIILSSNIKIGDFGNKSVGRMLSFKTTNAHDLKEKIELIYKSRKERQKAINVSRYFAMAFTQEKMVNCYKDLIKEITSS